MDALQRVLVADSNKGGKGPDRDPEAVLPGALGLTLSSGCALALPRFYEVRCVAAAAFPLLLFLKD